jgi:hypothetical protein
MADVAWEWVTYYVHNFYNNITHMLDGMNSKRWIRLIAVVGAYFLIRPYILKFGAKIQAEEHEKSIHSGELEDKAKKAKISANSIRGQVEIPDSENDESDVAEEVTGNEPQWGKKARKRSRKVVREILEEQERRLEEDDMEDIKEFLETDVLVDYEEGKDGW